MTNKWWEYNFEDKIWELYFTPYYDDILIGKLYKDKNCDEDEWCCLYLDHKYCDYEFGELDDIKELIEDRIYEYYIDESNYYKTLAEAFIEK